VSQFERSLALARYLTSEPLRNVRTVAFISGDITGHSVLPVLACEELVAAPEAILGDAGEPVNRLSIPLFDEGTKRLLAGGEPSPFHSPSACSIRKSPSIESK
jgi:hypothetical protein